MVTTNKDQFVMDIRKKTGDGIDDWADGGTLVWTFDDGWYYETDDKDVAAVFDKIRRIGTLYDYEASDDVNVIYDYIRVDVEPESSGYIAAMGQYLLDNNIGVLLKVRL
jgi:hypothetical protein